MYLELDPNEQILFHVRKHWFTMLGPYMLILVLAFAPPIFLALLRSLEFPLSFSIDGSAISLGFFFYSIWLLALWIFAFMEWTDFYLDVWYVTNKRIVDIDQRGIFHREVSSLHYSKIQDVTTDTRGIIPTLFNFGDVHVQTAGENREIIMKSAARPEDVKRIITNQIERNAGHLPDTAI